MKTQEEKNDWALDLLENKLNHLERVLKLRQDHPYKQSYLEDQIESEGQLKGMMTVFLLFKGYFTEEQKERYEKLSERFNQYIPE